jgi:anti-sigma factor RsiW
VTAPCLGATLSALVDGALSHDERERAHAHLARCAVCRQEVESQRAVKARLARLAMAPEPPATLLTALRGLAVPGVEPRDPATLAAGRPVVVGPPGRASTARPPARPPRRASRRRRVLRRSGAVGAGVLAVGISAALALGGPATTAPSTPVDPGSDAFVVDFVSTTTDVPLADPAGGAAMLPRP